MIAYSTIISSYKNLLLPFRGHNWVLILSIGHSVLLPDAIKKRKTRRFFHRTISLNNAFTLIEFNFKFVLKKTPRLELKKLKIEVGGRIMKSATSNSGSTEPGER